MAGPVRGYNDSQPYRTSPQHGYQHGSSQQRSGSNSSYSKGYPNQASHHRPASKNGNSSSPAATEPQATQSNAEDVK
jgi:hypothetical protein